jgi:hypothetical protein
MDEQAQPSPEKKPFWPAAAQPAPVTAPTPPAAPVPPPTVESTASAEVPPPPPLVEAVTAADETVAAAQPHIDPAGATSANAAGKNEDFREKMKPVMENAKTAAVTAASQAAKMAEQGARNAWPVIEPLLKRCWLNLRIWVPQLSNPDFRAAQIVYHGSDALSDGVWHVELARQCWKTGQTEGLFEHKIEVPLRSHENPLQIVLATTATLMVLFLLGYLMTVKFFLYLIAIVIGFGVLWLKSWPEHVRFVYYAGKDVPEPMPEPQVVGVDGKLTVVTVDRRLADATRKAIAAKRAAFAQSRTPGAAPSAPPSRSTMSLDDRPGSAPSIDPTIAAQQRARAPEPTPPVTPISNYKRDELPPLKLDD